MTEDTQGDPLRDHPPVSQNLIRNPISLIGMALAAVAFANIVFLVLIDVLASQPSPYIGILAYMVAPGFLVLGLILIPIGMVIERRRRLRAVGAPTSFPKLDLNNPAQRSTVAFRAQLRGDLLPDERGGQLQGLRVHRLGAVSADSSATP